MIVTVTPNPSIDRTVEVDAIIRGGVARSGSRQVHAGGKGINVARALLANEVSSLAVLPVGGDEGAQLVHLLDAGGVPHMAVPVAGPTRSNVTIVESDGTTTKLNEPGPTLSSEELAELLRLAATALVDASWLVTAGSLPAGADADLHATLVELAHERGAKAAVDASGPALLRALDAGPDLIKPNEDELAEAVGRRLATFGDVIEAAHHLRDLGAGAVLTSLGSRGAILVDQSGAALAQAPKVVARSTVGAGDCALAGFLAATVGGGDSSAALQSAVAFGTAAVQLSGTTVPGPNDLRRDGITIAADIDLRTPLASPVETDHDARDRVR